MSLKWVISTRIKSQLAGFFAFILLSACQPAPDGEAALMQQAQTDAGAAMTLARQRLANAEYDAALHWMRQAAHLGDSQALQHALQLQQRQQGRLATAQWLQQQLDSNNVTASSVSAAQRAELGLWQGNRTSSAGYQHPQSCQLTLQPVASQQAGVDTWQQLLQQWQKDAQLSQLPICFLPLHTINSTSLQCSEDSNSLLQCRYQALEQLVANGDFSQLVVVAGRGKASYNNGILQLPDNAGLALFRHEFMHILGFIDEYQLPVATAQQVCQSGKFYPNIIVTESANADVAAYLQQWQLDAESISLTAVDSCKHTHFQAYRVVAESNLMRSFELQMPPLYFKLAQHILRQPQELMPVQYYFAYLARQQEDWQRWQHYMRQASELGYSDAQQALAP
jgi:phage terminase Nu1 subunit (DNA packaging protein)